MLKNYFKIACRNLFKNDFPQIERVVRIQTGGGTVRYKDKVFKERFRFVKIFFIPSFSSLFDIPLKLDFLGNMNLWVFLVAMLILRYFHV